MVKLFDTRGDFILIKLIKVPSFSSSKSPSPMPFTSLDLQELSRLLRSKFQYLSIHFLHLKGAAVV